MTVKGIRPLHGIDAASEAGAISLNSLNFKFSSRQNGGRKTITWSQSSIKKQASALMSQLQSESACRS